MNFTVNPLGEDALIIEFEQAINPDVLKQVLNLNWIITKRNIEGIKEVVTAYCSLAVFYDPLIISFDELNQEINSLEVKNGDPKLNKSQLWHVPLCFNEQYAPDLESISETKNISQKEIIQLFLSEEYLIYMLGFLPGFIYLGGLNETLSVPRKSSPSEKVPPGSVGIGGNQAGIYSIESPGGWHILGRTPSQLLDTGREEIISLAPGDRLKFYEVSQSEFTEISKQNNSIKPSK